ALRGARSRTPLRPLASVDLAPGTPGGLRLPVVRVDRARGEQEHVREPVEVLHAERRGAFARAQRHERALRAPAYRPRHVAGGARAAFAREEAHCTETG